MFIELCASQANEDNTMELYVIHAWADLQELEAAGAKSARIGDTEMSDRVRWIRSYVVKEQDGRIGTVCIYQARDVDSIREHAARVGMPAENIVPVVDTVIVRADPVGDVVAA
jgi:hypothetical protein